jgi:hypothetical protein
MFILRKVAKQNSAATARKLRNKVSESSCHVVIIAKRLRWKRKMDFVKRFLMKLSPRFVFTTRLFQLFTISSALPRLQEHPRQLMDASLTVIEVSSEPIIPETSAGDERKSNDDLHNQLQSNYLTRTPTENRSATVLGSERGRIAEGKFHFIASHSHFALNWIFSPFVDCWTLPS